MLDIKWIRENAEEFDRLLARRGSKPMSEEIINLDSERRQITTLMQQLQHSRKEKAKLMGMLKDKAGSEFESAKRDAEHINEKLSE